MKNFEKYKNRIIDYYLKHDVTLGVAIMKIQKEITKKDKDPLESFKWLYEEVNNSILDSTEKRIIREMLLEFDNKNNILITKCELDDTHNEIMAKQMLRTPFYCITHKSESIVVTGTLFKKMNNYQPYTLEELEI